VRDSGALVEGHDHDRQLQARARVGDWDAFAEFAEPYRENGDYLEERMTFR
jgi:hypothetical protein